MHMSGLGRLGHHCSKHLCRREGPLELAFIIIPKRQQTFKNLLLKCVKIFFFSFKNVAKGFVAQRLNAMQDNQVDKMHSYQLLSITLDNGPRAKTYKP